jgi:hypothetical protein
MAEKEKSQKSDLEKKLAGVISDLKEKLAKGEIACSLYSCYYPYYSFIEFLLKKHGISEKPRIGEAGYISVILEKKLGIERKSGIKKEYYIIRETPLSGEAKKDIAEYDKLKDELGIYLKRVIGNKKVSIQEFRKLIEGYVAKKLNRDSIEYEVFIPKMIGTYERQFNLIIPEKKYDNKIDRYTSSDIEKALSHIS